MIATLAGRAQREGIDVMVVTGDRDLFQLIEPGVRVMATGRGITDTKIYDREAVIDRYGIPPELIPDFVGLKGDTSDNIPGVPGIGDKTASQLLQEWGDLEGVLANIDSISGAKRKENLTEHAENARISKQLATAVRDVDVDVDFDKVIAREPDRSRLRETFREFELRAPLERLEEALGEDGAAPAERVDEVVEVPGARGAAGRARLARGRAGRDRGAAAGRGPGRGAPRRRRRGPRGGARRWRRTPPLEAVERGGAGRRRRRPRRRPAQGSFDFDGGPRGPLTVAAWAGDEVLVAEAETLAAFAMARGEQPGRGARLEDDRDGRRPLRRAAARPRHDGRRLPDRPGPARLPARRAGHRGRPGRRASTGARRRGRARGAHARCWPSASASASTRTASPACSTRSSCRWSTCSSRWSAPASSSTSSACARSARASTSAPIELERRVWELAGEEFTIGSPQQLAPILFEKLGLSRKRRGKTGFSTDARVLQAIRHEHEIVPAIEEWREVTKLKSTYLDAFPELIGADGRLHTTFNQTAADHRAPVEHQPEPPEHPDPHRAGPRDPRLLRGGGRAAA